MIALIIYSFSVAIFVAATALPETLHNAPIAIVDEDHSPLSQRLALAFYPPYFKPPVMVSFDEVDAGMDAGRYTFSVDIPPDFQSDVLDGRSPALQLNVDATRMSQAFTGSLDCQTILLAEVDEFVKRYRESPMPPVTLALRSSFNPNLERPWFGAVTQLIDHITLLCMILAGAALIREREHGTVEHLLVMPVTPSEIMIAKLWANGVVVLVATGLSVFFVVQELMKIPVQGSIPLYLGCTVLHLFAASSMAIFLATIARSMPQYGLLLILILLPMQILSGGVTPRESMPEFIKAIMEAAPTTHFVALSQGIIFRGGGIDVLWPQMLALAVIGTLFFVVALNRFRKTIGQMA
jgi:ABC-2 type transport system permease protein